MKRKTRVVTEKRWMVARPMGRRSHPVVVAIGGAWYTKRGAARWIAENPVAEGCIPLKVLLTYEVPTHAS